jgi:hypothetical protein
MTTAEVLDSFQVLNAEMVAYVLQLLHTRGEIAGRPDASKVRKLIREGKLRLVDPDQPLYLWRVSAAEVHRYMDGAPSHLRRVG